MDIHISRIKVLRAINLPILQQLYLEEQLLRLTQSNWLVTNHCRDKPTVVMGMSGKPHKLVNVELAKQ